MGVVEKILNDCFSISFYTFSRRSKYELEVSSHYEQNFKVFALSLIKKENYISHASLKYVIVRAKIAFYLLVYGFQI